MKTLFNGYTIVLIQENASVPPGSKAWTVRFPVKDRGKKVPFSNEKWWQFFGRWDSVWEISKKLLMKINCENWTIMHTLSYFILHWMHKKCSDSKRFSNKMFRFGIGCAYQCSCSLTNSHGCDPVTGKCQCNQVGSGDAFALCCWLECWWSWSWQWW